MARLLHTVTRSAHCASHTRSLQVKVGFGSIIATTPEGTPMRLDARAEAIQNTQRQALLDLNTAFSVQEAVQLLDALPELSSLELELVCLASGAYISRLPHSLESAIKRHAPALSHFGISAAQLRPLDVGVHAIRPSSPAHHAVFELDEGMTANLLTSLPNVQSIVLHQVGRDSSNYPLASALRPLKNLRKLALLSVQAALEPRSPDRSCFQAQLEELTLFPHVSPTSAANVQSILHAHSGTLECLTLIGQISPRARSPSTSAVPSPFSKLLDPTSASFTRSSYPSLRELNITGQHSTADILHIFRHFLAHSASIHSLRVQETNAIVLDSLVSILSQDGAQTSLNSIDLSLELEYETVEASIRTENSRKVFHQFCSSRGIMARLA